MVGVLLLATVRLINVVQVSWAFLAGFTVASVAANFAMTRLVRETTFRTGYVVLTLALGAAMISAVLYALDRTGYLLYGAYLIAPLQAALYLGRRTAWTALAINIAGFAIATFFRAGQPPWGWSIFLQATLVLLFTAIALIPLLAEITRRLRRTRRLLAQVERGDLAVRLNDPAADELGYLSASVDKTTAAVADAVREVQQQVQALFMGRAGARGATGGPLIQAEPVTNSLIVQADKADMDKIKDFAMRMDRSIGAQATEQHFVELV